MIKEFLEIGQIVGTHGVRGEMRLNPWADGPDFVKQFKTFYYDNNGQKSVRVISARPHGNVAILKLDGVDTVEKAAALRNKVLYIKRADAKIKEGSYFISELIGCDVYDSEDGNICYGVLSDVSETGANDVWHIKKDGAEYLIPAIPSVVKNVDVAKNRVEIKPLRGIFDDEN
ncbi:MAG: 16S rRNA processing protein RimM [Clostridia bacterium]|nr:16S rRNA processing protein RimM [Clostridia bacterium]